MNTNEFECAVAAVVLRFVRAGGRLCTPARLSAALALATQSARRGQPYALTNSDIGRVADRLRRSHDGIVDRGELASGFLVAC